MPDDVPAANRPRPRDHQLLAGYDTQLLIGLVWLTAALLIASATYRFTEDR